MSYATCFIRTGRTMDPDCMRASNRLMEAMRILESQGIERPETTHRNEADEIVTEFGWRFPLAPEHRCSWRCKPEPMPAWVTDEIINAAWGLADRIITERASAIHREIARERWSKKTA